jgi:hypothetical protein
MKWGATMKSKIFFITVVIILTTFNSLTHAQQPRQDRKLMSKEDSAALNALVLYPDSTRLAIFEAAEYPAIIVNLATLQKNSSEDFSALISSYAKDEQEDLYNLCRYPGLISNLVRGGTKSDNEINSILANYPIEIRETALKYADDPTTFETLQKIDNFQTQINARFEDIISGYSPVAQSAFRQLIQLPDVVNLLNDHLELTVRVGDHYRRNPQWVIHRADSAYAAETKQHTEDAVSWQQSIQQNPDAATDLQSAASDYAQQNGYSQDEINTAPNPEVVANYTCYPYSYWTGYPSWYPYSYWYPYPFWFDCGFYRDSFGHMVVLGPPSPYFTNWYFYSPEHWNRYPHLADHYIGYYRTRPSVTRNAIIVRGWVHDNKRLLPSNFLTDRTQRVRAIQDVGRMHVEMQKQLGTKPVAEDVREQFIQKNISKYPTLRYTKPEAPRPSDRTPTVPAVHIEQPVTQPSVRINRPELQPTSRSQPIQQQPERSNQGTPASRFNDIQRAQQYHSNTWEQAKPVSRPQPQPQAKQQPARQSPPGSNQGGSSRKEK